jgi:hypothetical protein
MFVLVAVSIFCFVLSAAFALTQFSSLPTGD